MTNEPAPATPLADARSRVARLRHGLRLAGRFAALTARKSGRDGITLQASALAFETVFATIPLLAAFLFVGGHVFDEYRPQVLAILRQVLPYTEDRLLEQINEFLTQTQQLRGIGILGFAFVALIAFVSVESTLNRIWLVHSARTWGRRLYSFFMLLLWGPLLIGAVYSVLAVLRRQTAFDQLWHESLPVMAIPFVVTTCGLTMLYWLVPNTAVRLRCAAAGGASAALLLELLRAGFKLYLEAATGLSIVYGGFALALIFMVSIDAAWTIVLLGCEISYTAQHFGSMSRRRRTVEPLEGGWLGLVVLALLAEEAARGRPVVALEELASRLELPSENLRLAIAPLLAERWLREAGRRGEGLTLGRDLADARLDSLFAVYDKRLPQLFAGLSPAVRDAFAALHERSVAARRQSVAEASVASISSPPDPGSQGPVALDSTRPVP
jgi:membrane protein